MKSGLLILLVLISISTHASVFPNFMSKWVGVHMSDTPIEMSDGKREYVQTRILQRLSPIGDGQSITLGTIYYTTYPSDGSELKDGGKNWFKSFEIAYGLSHVRHKSQDGVHYFEAMDESTSHNLLCSISYRNGEIHYSLGFYREAHAKEAAPEFRVLQSALVIDPKSAKKTSWLKAINFLSPAYAQSGAADVPAALGGLTSQDIDDLKKGIQSMKEFSKYDFSAISALDAKAVGAFNNAFGNFTISKETIDGIGSGIKNLGNIFSGIHIPSNKFVQLGYAGVGLTGIQIFAKLTSLASQGIINGTAGGVKLLAEFLSGKYKRDQESEMFEKFKSLRDDYNKTQKDVVEKESTIAKFVNTFKGGKPLSYYYINGKLATLKIEALEQLKKGVVDFNNLKSTKDKYMEGSSEANQQKLDCNPKDIQISLEEIESSIKKWKEIASFNLPFKSMCRNVFDLLRQVMDKEVELEEGRKEILKSIPLAKDWLLRSQKEIIKEGADDAKTTADYEGKKIEGYIKEVELGVNKMNVDWKDLCPKKQCDPKHEKILSDYNAIFSADSMKPFKSKSSTSNVGDEIISKSNALKTSVSTLMGDLDKGAKDKDKWISFYNKMKDSISDNLERVGEIKIATDLRNSASGKDPSESGTGYNINANDFIVSKDKIEQLNSFSKQVEEERSGVSAEVLLVDSKGVVLKKEVGDYKTRSKELKSYGEELKSICADLTQKLEPAEKKFLLIEESDVSPKVQEVLASIEKAKYSPADESPLNEKANLPSNDFDKNTEALAPAVEVVPKDKNPKITKKPAAPKSTSKDDW